MDSLLILKLLDPAMNQPLKVLQMKDFQGHETHPYEDRLLETDSFR